MANQRLNAIITIGGAVSGSLKSALGSTQSKLKGLGSTIRDLEKKQKVLGQQLDAPMGRNVRLLRQEYTKVGDELDKVRKKQKRITDAHEGMGQGKAMMASGATGVGIVGAVAKAGIYHVIEAAKFETAMLGVAKQVEGSRDKSGQLTQIYHDMAREVQLLGREMPIATNEIAEMVAAGARMGVPRGAD